MAQRIRMSRFNVTALALGMAFLYLPIVILVIYSFNASRLVTVWGGWSLRWYTEFFNDRAMLDAAWMSLRVAAVSATIATLLGTLAAVGLVRGERFRGRSLFSGMLYAPLVMPEVISGLSLLLLFVALNAERGFWTVTIAHTTLTMCFVTVVVQSRLAALDRSLEEAAMDLGCNPVEAFLRVTLPLIVPAIAAGWMLAFTLSLDDVVIASFTTGPGSATLPIRIYSEVRLGVKPEINAICTMVIALIAVVIVIASLASKLSSSDGKSAAPLLAALLRPPAQSDKSHLYHWMCNRFHNPGTHFGRINSLLIGPQHVLPYFFHSARRLRWRSERRPFPPRLHRPVGYPAIPRRSGSAMSSPPGIPRTIGRWKPLWRPVRSQRRRRCRPVSISARRGGTSETRRKPAPVSAGGRRMVWPVINS